MTKEIKWTKTYVESLNELLKAIGMPTFVIDNGYAYKDELHKFVGIGIKLEDE